MDCFPLCPPDWPKGPPQAHLLWAKSYFRKGTAVLRCGTLPVWRFNVNCSMSLSIVFNENNLLKSLMCRETRTKPLLCPHSWYTSGLSCKWLLAMCWTMAIYSTCMRFQSLSQLSAHHQWWLEMALIQGKRLLRPFFFSFSVSFLVMLFAMCQTSNWCCTCGKLFFVSDHILICIWQLLLSWVLCFEYSP